MHAAVRGGRALAAALGASLGHVDDAWDGNVGDIGCGEVVVDRVVRRGTVGALAVVLHHAEARGGFHGSAGVAGGYGGGGVAGVGAEGGGQVCQVCG